MANAPPAYLASPPTGRGLPVLLLHTWWGLNQPIKDLADRLAADGFTVLAPDLFDGTVLTTIEEADAHGQKMDSEYERILGRLVCEASGRGQAAGHCPRLHLRRRLRRARGRCLPRPFRRERRVRQLRC